MFARTISLTFSGAPRSASTRSFWSASRRTCWTARSSSLTMSSNTNSMPRTSSARSLSADARRLEHVALGRAVGVVEYLGERLRARRRRSTRARRPPSVCGGSPPRSAGRPAALVSPMRAIRNAMSGCWRSGRRASTCAASVVSRLARISAIVCGDSLRSSAAVRSGGTRCRNSNGGRSVRADSRPSTSAARSGPSARSITPRAKSTPPATSESPSVSAVSSAKIESVVSAPTVLRRAISIDRFSISSSGSSASTCAARSEPSAAINTAALRAPDSCSGSVVAGKCSEPGEDSAGRASDTDSSAIEA